LQRSPPMWERLRRFNALPRPAKSVFLRALVLLPFFSLSLRMRGFRATQRMLQRSVPDVIARTEVQQQQNVQQHEHVEQHDHDAATVELTSRMILAASRYSPIPSTCLERSLALWWVLARNGISSKLRIGVRKDAGKFAAHAWVERLGTAIGEPESAHLHYAAFAEEISGESW
jgi:hypothetical protein